MLQEVVDKSVSKIGDAVLFVDEYAHMLSLCQTQVEHQENFQIIWVVLIDVTIVQAEIHDFFASIVAVILTVIVIVASLVIVAMVVGAAATLVASVRKAAVLVVMMIVAAVMVIVFSFQV